jgi:hypothetical protein
LREFATVETTAAFIEITTQEAQERERYAATTGIN